MSKQSNAAPRRAAAALDTARIPVGVARELDEQAAYWALFHDFEVLEAEATMPMPLDFPPIVDDDGHGGRR